MNQALKTIKDWLVAQKEKHDIVELAIRIEGQAVSLVYTTNAVNQVVQALDFAEIDSESATELLEWALDRVETEMDKFVPPPPLEG